MPRIEVIERCWNWKIAQPEFWPRCVASVRVIADVERNRSGPSGKIKRLFRIHRQNSHSASFITAGRIVIGGLPKLPITNDDVVGRDNGFGPSTSLDLRRRPTVVKTLAEVNIAGRTRYAPDIRIKITRAALDSRILGVKGVAEGHRAPQLQAAISGDRARCWSCTWCRCRSWVGVGVGARCWSWSWSWGWSVGVGVGVGEGLGWRRAGTHNTIAIQVLLESGLELISAPSSIPTPCR